MPLMYPEFVGHSDKTLTHLSFLALYIPCKYTPLTYLFPLHICIDCEYTPLIYLFPYAVPLCHDIRLFPYHLKSLRKHAPDKPAFPSLEAL